MAITKEFLAELGISVENQEKIFKEHGKSIESKKTELETLKADKKKVDDELKTANETIKGFKDNSEDVDALKTKISEYETAEKTRKENAEREQKKNKLDNDCFEILKDAEFTSDYVKNGIIADMQKQFADSPEKGLKTIFEEITKDKEGIFKNPNEPFKIEGSNTPENKNDDSLLMKAMGLNKE